MATKSNVAHEDLLKLEAKVNKEQTEYRHGLRSDMQKIYLDMDDIKSDMKLQNHSLSIIQKDIQESRKFQDKMADSISDLKDFMIKSIKEQQTENEKRFETKEKSDYIQEKVRWLEKVVYTVG